MKNHDTAFVSLLNRIAGNTDPLETKMRKEKVKAGKHPSFEMLSKYVSQELDPQAVGILDMHLLYCDFCLSEIADIIKIDQKTMEFYKDKILEDADPPPPVNISQIKEEKLLYQSQFYPRPIKKTAMTSHANEKTFNIHNQYFTLTYDFDETEKDINIGWKTNITYDCDFWVRFFDSRYILLAEFCLGDSRADKRFLQFEELPFDPVKEDWHIGISIVQRTI
ncbi:hypothetical protein SAMN02746065_12011 [Desulfocicer vacuolatum DSM 3385]|uniref:Zinc-finger n=1 Tax=Desulfocicer vacuolatum DSM 3385 TaxID=1121400 RepID=A0A1W2DS80_9BACT|nr:hypothetical protein [Desulfocicer vacuolatum]SMD00243.1 hypothetical protein SAMN02746065_12011 [Desulfocicer vacuolatum DSM 3385]